MTCREKLKLEHPHRVGDTFVGGCCSCPDGYGYLNPPNYCDHGTTESVCSRCWDREIPGTESVKKEPDIHKIIDDAMEKKDRTVSIFITKGGVSVNIQPKEDDPRWVRVRTAAGYTVFQCPACETTHDFISDYCPDCGEKLKKPI